MKKLLLTTCLLAVTMPVSFALAQTAPATTGQPDPNFAARKAEILQKMQQTQQCVQAAQNMDALRACRPKRPQHVPGSAE